MKYFFGLGNPGSEYQNTRHNVGFLFADFLAEKKSLGEFKLQKKLSSELVKSGEIIVGKPQTFMNDSGRAVQAVLSYYSHTHQLLIAFDDLDLPFGTYKIQLNSGPKVHNGLNSVRTVLKTSDFWSIRIGVDGRDGDRSIPGQDYVLSNFSRKELEALAQVFDQILQELEAKQLF